MFQTTPTEAKKYFNDYLDRIEKILGPGVCLDERTRVNQFFEKAEGSNAVVILSVKI